MGDYMTYTEGIKKSGHYLGGNELQPTHTATTVRSRGGKVSTTDGPFAETKEQLGGYYLIEAKDLNDAIQVASRIPSAKIGSIEVRPIHEFARAVADRRSACRRTRSATCAITSKRSTALIRAVSSRH